jgi:hypothetical protein
MSEPITSPNAVFTDTLIDIRVKPSLAHWQGYQEDLSRSLSKLLDNREINGALHKLSWQVWVNLSQTIQSGGLYLEVPHVCPGRSDNLMYTWSFEQHYLECEFFDSGEVEFFYRNRSTGETWGEDTSLSQTLSREIVQKAKLFAV